VNIVESLPIREDKFQIDVSGVGPVDILPYQIAFMVNLLIVGKATKVFPAVLDTGFNRNFGISERGCIERRKSSGGGDPQKRKRYTQPIDRRALPDEFQRGDLHSG
jgi:hypothetical protein